MPFFGMQYRVLFHDTMAYGSHHYLTNLKFQNIARETILFESKVNGRVAWEEQLKDLVLLTREAYCLNLAPVELGHRVAILLTYEDPTRSTVRLCFRVIREDGQPVSCGYQTMICMHRETQELVPAPSMVTQYLDSQNPGSLIEKLTKPSFADRLKNGATAVKDIFPKEIIELGKYIARTEGKEVYPRIIDESLNEFSLEVDGELPSAGSGIVFTFSGQGSYDVATLRAMYEQFPEVADYFNQADKITRQMLGQEFLQVILAPAEEHDRLLAANPDVTQIGIYLAGALISKLLIARGLKPEILVGHSIGELAALATAGVYSIETGLEIVCRRVAALRSSNVYGQMAAVSCGAERAAEFIQSNSLKSLQIAVVNHQKQTVLSGRPEELKQLGDMLVAHGISMTRVESPFPFHSSLLAPAVDTFRKSLSNLQFSAAQIPVYHCTERTCYSPGKDLPEILSRQFIRQLNFLEIVERLRRGGFNSFVECGGGEIVTRLIRKIVREDPAVKTIAAAPRQQDLRAGIETALRSCGVEQTAATSTTPDNSEAVRHNDYVEEEPTAEYQTPIAIVGMGCVLPGAGNPDQYWQNIKNGVSGVVDLAAIDPNARRDFMAGSVENELHIIPDKSYSLLNGTIVDIPYDARVLNSRITSNEFDKLSRGQRLLALALGQALVQQPDATWSDPSRVQCILGATADGASEFDEAAVVESLQDETEKLDEPAKTRTLFSRAIEEVSGYRRGDCAGFKSPDAYKSIVNRFLTGVHTYVVDSACSSSLYAVNLGIKALICGDADVVLVGGVFAPGPANNTLFAQFRGLSATGSRPLDKDADGVIFGDGAAILVLKRLSEALEDNSKPLAVIRGMGLSSDGKSPSINVPQSKGQSLAVRRALQHAGVQLDSIQYVEAHATGTPVGDKVETSSLREVFGDKKSAAGPIELASVKSLIGHTGWVSGAASIIKICKAFEEQTVPKQSNFSSADPELGLEESPFTIANENHRWTKNKNGYPRRAGINGFGFGGTNAHLVLEEFDETYHRRLCSRVVNKPDDQTLTLVGIGSLFPARETRESDGPQGTQKFRRDDWRLPAKKILLPDVVEHMDLSQFLVALAAEKIFKTLPESWTQIRDEIGVVVGLESKTERGLKVNNRIFMDRMLRLFDEAQNLNSLPRKDAQRVIARLADHVRSTHAPSGPYTLPGLMPNVTASRVASLFDLKGPNMVIDDGNGSLFQSLIVAQRLLEQGDCKMVLAGAVNVFNGDAGNTAECAVLMAITTEKFARESGFPMLARFDAATSASADTNSRQLQPAQDFDYRAATGTVEMLAALNTVTTERSSVALRETAESTTQRRLLLMPPTSHEPSPAIPPKLTQTYAYVRDTPIYRYTPELIPEPASAPARSLKDRRLLVLTDQPEQWRALEQSRALDALNYHAVFPANLNADGAVQVDFSSEEQLANSIRKLDDLSYDIILAIKFLADDAASFISDDKSEESGLLELLFAVCRANYDRIRDGRLSVINLSLGALGQGNPHPYTGLTAGFMKSLARELPQGRLSIVHTDQSNFLKAVRYLETEIGKQETDRRCDEVFYIGGQRYVPQLRKIENLARDNQVLLDEKSVVLATGGGRGVTAVLVEELLARFGCTVIAAGRTDLSQVDDQILSMDDAAFREYEKQFYKQELARDGSQKISDLKMKLARYQAANEVSRTVKFMKTLPGRFEYRSVDLCDRQALNRLIDTIYEQHGKIDLVLHGAGIQRSVMLTRKSLADFRRVVSSKLASLRNMYQAISRHQNGRPVHYHLLTSAFSYMGNDGQPDYGAANEALNRIAATLDDPNRGHWSSMAWLGWAGIGMTRGSEFAALAASRRLRGVTREEGRSLFSELMNGTATAPINILLADGEIKYYDVPLAKTTAPPKSNGKPVARSSKKEEVLDWDLTVDNAPFLRDHLVDGLPTTPAALLTCIVADAAKKLRPELQITAYEDTRYHRFVRVSPESGAQLRAHALLISENDEESIVHVRILSDFVHKSGRVLQKDRVHCETMIHMTPNLPKPPPRLFDANDVVGVSLPDPYVIPGSRVWLKGQFASTRRINVGPSWRIGDYKLADYRYPDSKYNHLLPNIIFVDAFWRFGTVQLLRDQTLGVYVPARCGVMKVYFDYLQFDNPNLIKNLTFRGTNPRIEGDLLHVGPIDVSDANGNVLLVVEQGVCRKFGEVTASSLAL